ncbi:tetratricopeptide repeat protein [Cycloclasticus sp.]|uniref:tetratricopeptide repeat protein n=1 Tax=Cycloclasticus sp. TaxID=2024830 RepID=UPI000C1074E3|nr:tetratricopeptide repeat protein [Cycloclasticus sp.]PHR49460.1 MAG: hypothetical protein COA48_07765 [Cycloclasticus sp.]
MSKLKFVIVLMVAIVSVSACGSAKDSAAAYIESGQELLADGKIDKARVEFKNALQIEPKSAEAHYQLALLDENAKNWKSMFARLTRVEALDPKHYEAILKLGQLYVMSGDTTLALEQANKVFKDTPKNTGALILKSSALFKQDKYVESLTEVNKALSIEPSNIEASSLKAVVLNKLGKPQEALAILTKTIKLKPDDLSLNILKLTILEQQQKYNEMEYLYEQLIAKNPTQKWIYISLVQLFDKQGKYLEAKETLEALVASQPNTEETKLFLVSYIQDKEPNKALALLNDYITSDNESFELRFSKVDLLLYLNKKDEAIVELKKITELDNETGEYANKANVMLAYFDLQNNQQKAALNKINSVLENSPENENALLTLAKIELNNNNFDPAITHLRVILRNNPESEETLVLLAQAYLNSDSEELAEDSFRQTLTINPSNKAAALFVSKKLIESNDLERAELVLTKALNAKPEDDDLLDTLAQTKLLKKDWLGTETIANKWLEDNENSVKGLYLSARLLQAQEKHLDAIEAYKKVLEKTPEFIPALQGLAFSSIEINQKNELLTFLDSFIESNPRQVAAYAIQANIYKRDKQFDEAATVLNKGLKTEAQWLQGYSALASIYILQQQIDKAVNVYKTGLNLAPDNNELSIRLASLYEQNNEFSKAKALYEEVLERDSNIEPAINNLASLLTDQFRSEENLNIASTMTEAFKDSKQPHYLDTYAWVLVQQEQLNIAQPVLERVVSLSPNVAVFNYHLGVLYAKQKAWEDARTHLEAALGLAHEERDQLMIQKIKDLLSSIE